jgi:uncharacterized membrane protein
MTRRIVFRLRQWTRGMSTWLIPLAGALIGMALVPLQDWLDDQVALPVPLRFPAATAIEVLAVVIIAEAVLIGFAITMAALGAQKATGAFAAGITPPWYPDTHFKVLLAVLVGTLTFSFWGIGHVVEGDVPHLSVSAAGVGLAIGLVLLVVNLDRVLRLTQPISVAAMMAREARRAFESELLDAARPDTAFVPMGPQRSEIPPCYVLRARRDGTLQAMDRRGFVGFAEKYDCIVVFRRSIGEFVSVGDPILEIQGATPPRATCEQLHGLFAIGVGRRVEQDPSFAIRIMVDIATRALSSDETDPTTAVQVIDHLGATLRLMGSAPARLAAPGSLTMDAGVIVPVPDWPDTLALATTEIREYAAGSVQVTRRLRALLDDLADTVRPENRPAVFDERRRLEAQVEGSFAASVDRDRAQAADPQGLGGPAVRTHRPTPVPGDLRRPARSGDDRSAVPAGVDPGPR